MDEQWGPRIGRRRNKQWRPVSRGLHRPVADPRPHADLHAWQLVLPETGAFTHLTAADLHGWWLPPVPPWLPVFACRPASTWRSRRPGLRVTRLVSPVVWEWRDGLRVATAAETLLACACDLGLLDLVVLIDAALHLGACDRSELERLAGSGRRGSRRLRRALALDK